MSQELLEKIMLMLNSQGICDRNIESQLIIIMNDYEIKKCETAVTIYKEDVNDYYLKRFLITKTVKGCTERTLRCYQTEIRKILEKIGKSAAEITSDDIRYYLVLREKRDKIKKTTLNNELRFLRTFFGWLNSEELIPRNPTAKIEAIRGRKEKKTAFTDIEVEKMRDACQNSKELAIIEILLSTGCRVSELVGIMISDLTGNAVVVHGKGEKDRVVYLNAKAQIAIEKYMNDRKDENPYLFPGMFSVKDLPHRDDCKNSYKYPQNVLPEGHMDADSVEDRVRKIAKRCGVTNAHPHRFRRTFATFAMRRGMPIEQVSALLGHEQISTTQIYLDIDEKSLEQAHEKYVV